jgi:predicted ArsR family transcriptional regulator
MATRTRRNRKPTTRSTKAKVEAADARRTKANTILELLQRPTGASIAELTKATGWQSHSVRAALTGLRKKGREVVRTKDDQGVTRYCIAAGSGS